MSLAEYWINPFRADDNRTCSINEQVHPVEAGLEWCNYAVEKCDSSQFKDDRQTVINYLERQYIRIVTASANMIYFIKEQKCRRGLFDVGFPEFTDDEIETGLLDLHFQKACGEGCVLLEEYVNAFKRELTPAVRAAIFTIHNDFESYYDMPREKAMQALYNTLRPKKMTKQTYNYQAFRENFKFVVEDLEDQLVEIQKARRALFECDTFNRPRCNIDVNLGWMGDSRIDWTVNEPEIQPTARR